MSKPTYNFIAGDKLYAKDVNSIDPDNPVAQSPAKLIGGDDVVLQNFIDLGLGDNDGAFKATIDGVEYDLAIDINSEAGTPENAISQTSYDVETKTSNLDIRQSFTTLQNQRTISAITINTKGFSSSGGTPITNFVLSLYDGEIDSGGDLLATKTVNVTSSAVKITFDSAINIKRNTKYHFRIQGTGGSGTRSWAIRRQTGNVYTSGKSSLDDDIDLYFIIEGALGVAPTSLESVASIIEEYINDATSKLETVVWDTDHFEITSTISGKNNGSQVLKLQAPTTGTDISGAGYLDLGANATEIAGAGDDYKIIRANRNGQVPIEKLKDLTNQIGENQVISGKALNTAYQNTSEKTRLVIVSIGIQAASNQVIDCYGKIGTTSTPDIVVSRVRDGGSSYTERMTIPMILLVPPNYYYKIETSGSYNSTPAIDNWFECDLI